MPGCIFTQREVPFAGHPNVGTAYVIIASGTWRIALTPFTLKSTPAWSRSRLSGVTVRLCLPNFPPPKHSPPNQAGCGALRERFDLRCC